MGKNHLPQWLTILWRLGESSWTVSDQANMTRTFPRTDILIAAPSSTANRENATVRAPTRAKRAYIDAASDYEETSGTGSAAEIIRARASTSTQASEDLNEQSAHQQAMSAEIGVQFMSDEGLIVRQRPWSECDSVRALFIQATIARIIKPQDTLAALFIRVLERDVMIMKDDEQDFQELQNILKAAGTVKQEDAEQQTQLDIQVYALEEN